MRKVGIVLRNLSKAGVTRYISNVLKTIDTNPDFHKNFEFYIIFNDDNSKLIDGTPLSEFGTNFKKLKIKGKNTLLWDYIYSSLSLRKQDFDVIIYPKNNIPFTHKFVKSKKINIMHDLLDFSNVKKNRILNSIYNRFLFKISCKLADITIAVSESTKKDIVKHLEVPSNKVKVIYEAVEDIFKPVRKKKEILSKYSINKPFIFYVGSDVGRKNIKRLAKSFNSIEKQIPHELILAGNIRRQYNSQRIKKIGYVNNEDLVQLYNQADLYVYPSLYEGFGLPILEAQACGCPVLTSNVTSMPEVAGYGAHIVNPYSEKEIAEGMEKILNDKKYREELIKKGFENVKRFSWEKTARDILKVCKDLSKNPRRS